MYCQRFGRLQSEWVADFLMLDREFPRAMHPCLIKAEESLHAISGAAPGTFRNPAAPHLGRLRTVLDYAQSHEILGSGLHKFLDTLQVQRNEVGTAIFETFFALRAWIGHATVIFHSSNAADNFDQSIPTRRIF